MAGPGIEPGTADSSVRRATYSATRGGFIKTMPLKTVYVSYEIKCCILSLKRPIKIAADDILFFYFNLSKKMRLDFSCEDSLETSSLIISETKGFRRL